MNPLFVKGTVKRHNCRDSNPSIFYKVHTQQLQNLNVWASIFGDRLVRPFLLSGNLTAEMYLQLLEDVIIPALTDFTENDKDGI